MKRHDPVVHLDLFSGIGGFALAADRVWPQGGVRHIFCDSDPFAQEVLHKHWPDAPIFGDIRELTADTERRPFLLTGGFPCQPFSAAGRRRGTEDDRHLWPEMARVIREFKPAWVIAENVGGLITWSGGMVFEQVCADLEDAGYEVQAFVIPAVAVDAPHRRDRIWFVARRQDAHDTESRRRGIRLGKHQRTAPKQVDASGDADQFDTHAPGARRGQGNANARGLRKRKSALGNEERRGLADARGNEGWREDWFKVAARLCRVDDGLPRRMDRGRRLKALGNAIVPQIAEMLMRAILYANTAG